MLRLQQEARGAAGQQYAIVVGLIGVIGLFAVSQAGSSVSTVFATTSNRLAAATNGATIVSVPVPDVPAPPDLDPDAFSFTAATNQAINAVVNSNIVTVNGFTGPLMASVSAPSGSPKIAVNGGSFTSGPTAISPGQTLQVQLTASGSFSTGLSATVSLGSASANFSVTTGALPCGPSSPGGGRCMFVTSTLYDGAFGGLTQADNICQARATAVGLSGTWKALLSNQTTSASSRVTVAYPVKTLTGVTIESTNLYAGSLESAPNISELGTVPSGQTGVWTSSNVNGSTKAADHCSNWTFNTVNVYSPIGRGGDMRYTNDWWIDTMSSVCWYQYRFYCLQQ